MATTRTNETPLEREIALADNICKTQVESLVEAAGGVTLGGKAIAYRYKKKWESAGYSGLNDAFEALLHWVVCAGYDSSGRYVYELSSHRL